MKHNVLKWQEKNNITILDMFAQRSLISTTMTLLKIHGHFYAQKVYIFCKKHPKLPNFILAMWKGLRYDLPCVVCPLVGIQKHLALHIFGPNFGRFKLKIIMDGQILFDVFVLSTPSQYCESPLRSVWPPFVLTFGCRS